MLHTKNPPPGVDRQTGLSESNINKYSKNNLAEKHAPLNHEEQIAPEEGNILVLVEDNTPNISDEKPPLIPEGEYLFGFEYATTAVLFNQPKLILHFVVLSKGV